MICPAAPSSASIVKVSGATWLDRLRSSRGFPPADTLDLDQFISSQSSPSTALEPRRLASLHSVDEEEEDDDGEGEDEDLNDILCELFVMGGGSRRMRGESSNRAGNSRKSSRKQQNPRFWNGTGSSKKSSSGGYSDDLSRQKTKRGLNRNNSKLASSGDNSLNQNRKERESKDLGNLGQDGEDKEVDMKGFSKSEVTVIDSSIQGWKVELLVFRKRKSKSMWKIREKTNKSRSLVNERRKRKFGKPYSSDDDDDYENDYVEEKRKKKKKKMILGISDSSPDNSFKNGKEVAPVPFINEGRVREEKLNHMVNGAGYLPGEATIRSSHWKSKGESSSVVLVKPLSTFDKPVSRKPGNGSVSGGQGLL